MEGFVRNRWTDLGEIKIYRMDFWTAEALSILASEVGFPLFADRTTSERTRLAYARVCVETGVENELFEELPVKVAQAFTPKVPTLGKPGEPSVKPYTIPKVLGLERNSSPIAEKSEGATRPTLASVLATPMPTRKQGKAQPRVYRANLYLKRRELWQFLGGIVTMRKPWVVVGDFNEDKTFTSGDTHPPSIAMLEFNNCLEAMDVTELSSHGSLYTWSPNW
ncbi:hypothetical protein LIER_16168 [Lithospermum erythrorhizon]|uniref:Uncharacterized protein n=1 Tax=Lithospermum erythrorhizon TaxID=34254 RepID=A0AAV3Q9R7_LITER